MKNTPGYKDKLKGWFQVHYGWFVVVAGMLCLFACLGLGRFALGMLLPSMEKNLHLSYSQMGLIGTCNFIGYLLGIICCSPLSKRYGPRMLISAALLLIGASMISIGLAANFYIILPLYILTGIGSALANVPMMGLVSTWFASRKRGQAAGFIVMGNGIGIILSGKLIPFINTAILQGWRINWVILGCFVLAIALVCYLIIRSSPGDLGLQPVGAASQISARKPPSFESTELIQSRMVLQCAAIYFIFGFTYVIYATFIVTVAIQEHGFTEATAGNVWSWIGFLSLFSGPVFGIISDWLGRKPALIMVFIIQAFSYFLVGFRLPQGFLYLSIFCYGIVAWSIPSIMAAMVGDYVGPNRAVAVFSFVTFVLAIGQIIGPFLAGIFADQSGSFTSSFLLASFMAMTAVILSLFLPKIKENAT